MLPVNTMYVTNGLYQQHASIWLAEGAWLRAEIFNPAQEKSDVKCDLVQVTTPSWRPSLLKGVKNVAEANSKTPSPSYNFKVVLMKTMWNNSKSSMKTDLMT